MIEEGEKEANTVLFFRLNNELASETTAKAKLGVPLGLTEIDFFLLTS